MHRLSRQPRWAVVLGLILALGRTFAHAAPDEPLRVLAEKRGVALGAAVSFGPLRDDPQYAETLSREFNALTPENALKFDAVHPAAERYNFEEADALVSFAEAQRMLIRGHTLVWHRQLPDWLKNGGFSREKLREILREHIHMVVGRYQGRIVQWDVVNEAIDAEVVAPTFWVQGVGDDVYDFAFRCAHEADPQAKLFYNDYAAEGLGKKSDAVYAFVQGLKARGVPIDGVGLQLHINADQPSRPDDLRANLARLAALGLEVAVTECDVPIDLPVDAAKLRTQAAVYAANLRAALLDGHCPTFVLWGVSDRYSWIPEHTQGRSGAALLFDATFQAKPAQQAVAETLREPGQR